MKTNNPTFSLKNECQQRNHDNNAKTIIVQSNYLRESSREGIGKLLHILSITLILSFLQDIAFFLSSLIWHPAILTSPCPSLWHILGNTINHYYQPPMWLSSMLFLSMKNMSIIVVNYSRSWRTFTPLHLAEWYLTLPYSVECGINLIDKSVFLIRDLVKTLNLNRFLDFTEGASREWAQ